MEKTNNRNKKIILTGAVILIVLIAAFALIYTFFIAKPVQGLKNIHIEVVHKDETSKTFDIQTEAKFLRQALEEKNLIKGKESQGGLYVLTVDGETVDEAKQEWWCFTENKETLNTGVDTTPVKDGDQFEITFKVGW